MIRALATFALVLTVAITAASAFIRHHGAGLGCSPWPECYAESVAPRAPDEASAVHTARAVHRITAGTVGILVLLITFVGWTSLRGRGERIAAVAALVVTLGLAWLGRYTPHDIPAVTLGNVIGGFTLAGLLAWLAARPSEDTGRVAANGAGWVTIAPAAMVLQTASGSLISARHAVTACGLFGCAASDAAGALSSWAAFDVFLAGTAGAAPQIAHRVMAIVTAGIVLLAARQSGLRVGTVLVALVIGQFATGLATVAGLDPLFTATLHNALSATLVGLLAACHRRAWSRGESQLRLARA